MESANRSWAESKGEKRVKSEGEHARLPALESANRDRAKSEGEKRVKFEEEQAQLPAAEINVKIWLTIKSKYVSIVPSNNPKKGKE